MIAQTATDEDEDVEDDDDDSINQSRDLLSVTEFGSHQSTLKVPLWIQSHK